MTVETHPKKKVEIIAERAVLPRVIDLVNEAGATGYTVLPAMAGLGRSGAWSGDAVFSATEHVLVMVLTTEAVAQTIIERARAALAEFDTIVFLTDVRVVRDDHF